MAKIFCILDGLGLSTKIENNAVQQAKMPNFKELFTKYPWVPLNADGGYVGQETGLVGNSEVGHMNLGGLQMVKQLSYQITQSAQKSFQLDTSLAPDQIYDPAEIIKSNFSKTSSNKKIHLLGLFSTGTIHSDLRHWVGAIEAAGQSGAQEIIMHIVSDGRDSDRRSLLATWNYFTQTYEDRIAAYESKIVLGSLGGRYFAMDRDKNWSRTASYLSQVLNVSNLDTNMKNELAQVYQINFTTPTSNAQKEIIGLSQGLEGIKQVLQKLSESSYQKDIFDENIETLSASTFSDVDRSIKSTELLWLINFRSDRMKQLTTLLCVINRMANMSLMIMANNDYGVGLESEFTQADTDQISLGYIPIFKTKVVQNTLADILEKEGKTQLHLAETEKYAHVTYFFNGGKNERHNNEEWLLIPSNKVSSHAEKPEMKAKEVTDAVLDSLEKYDFIVVNYANADMVGHTGDLEACVTSLEFLDMQLGRLVKAVEDGGHSLLITADHGNVEEVGHYEKGGLQLTDTEHNPNLVPCVLVGRNLDINVIMNRALEVLNKFNLDASGIDFDEMRNRFQSHENRTKQNWLTDEDLQFTHFPLWLASVILWSM